MKAKIFSKVIFLAVTVATGTASMATGAVQETNNNQPATALPANNVFKTKFVAPIDQVEKLAGAGIPEDVIKAYVENYPSAFNLTTDNIIHLQGIGISGAVLTEILNHDKALRDAATLMNPPVAPPSAYPEPQPGEQPAIYPTNPQPATAYAMPDNYNDLAGYGNWTYDDGYGWGWQAYPGLAYANYPWGLLGYGGWLYWPNRGWCWTPNSRFHTFGRGGAFVGNRFGGGFNRSFGGNRSFSGFHGNFNSSMPHSIGGSAHFSSGGHTGGFSGGGHSGGFSGGHTGGFSGGHGGGGHR